MTSLTYAKASEVLTYDKITGILRWKIDRPGRGCKAGRIAGTRRPDGYITLMIDGHRYLAHRLAHLLVNGKWPEHTIDHEDTDPSNNTWDNIRGATQSQNSANRGLQSNNTSGHKGVRERNGRFIAAITVNRKQIHLGHFDTLVEAIAARHAAEKHYFGEFARAA